MITGKPLEKGGIVGRDTATADGAIMVLDALLADQHRNVEKLSVAIQGAGNAGARAAEVLAERSTKVVALADSSGTLSDANGLDIPAVLKIKEEKGELRSAGHVSASDDVIAARADILIPAALEEQVNAGNMADVKADIILEVANGPVTPEADDVLSKRGVAIVPDVLANAGGVTVSYFEWLQNRSGDTWARDRVHDQLKDIMTDAYRDVADFATTRNVTLREAAYALAISRILEASK
jgi:glutamate dehydrogenase/leucine dehydrogenase